MKYWAILVLALYVLIVVFTLNLVTVLSFQKPIFTFSDKVTWIYLGIIVLSQAALLTVPVSIAEKRPVRKRSIIPLILASSFMMALLVYGAVLAIVEALENYTMFESSKAAGALFLIIWLFWGWIFFRWSRKIEPRNFVERNCKYLFRGSILELLIAVPAHIVARQRNDCCAGMFTFIGIACGISVMFFPSDRQFSFYSLKD